MNYRQDAKTPRKLEEPATESDRLANQVVDAAFQVHTELGPALLEGVYEVCLAHELKARSIRCERQVPLPVLYRNPKIEAGLRLDMLVESCLIAEIKAVGRLLPVHKAQVLTYLKLSKHPLGLLINFNVPLIKDGIKRIILSSSSSLATSRLGGLTL